MVCPSVSWEERRIMLLLLWDRWCGSGKWPEPFRSSLALDHLPWKGGFFRAYARERRPTGWGAGRACETWGALPCGSCRFTALHTSPSRAARNWRCGSSCTFPALHQGWQQAIWLVQRFHRWSCCRAYIFCLGSIWAELQSWTRKQLSAKNVIESSRCVKPKWI